MIDAQYYRDRAMDALREADEEPLPNARQKHIDAARAWQHMADRIVRVQAAADRKAAAELITK